VGVKPAEEKAARSVYAEVTLLFSDMRLADVRQEPGIGGAAAHERTPRFGEAQMAIHRQTDLRGILVFLSIVFPPANRAQHHRSRRLERPTPAARASKTNLGVLLAGGGVHIGIDAFCKPALTSGLSTPEGAAVYPVQRTKGPDLCIA
jgi:hypothetical protein